MTTLSRRHAILGALGLGGLAVAGMAVSRAGAAQTSFAAIGVQLYTVRDAFAADPAGTLGKLRGMGFDEVETISLGGKSAREFKAMLDVAGLMASSGHISQDVWFAGPEAALDDLAAIGATHAVLAWLPPEKRSGWKALAAKINGWATLAKARGLKMAYHNHDFEFVRDAEGMPFHHLLENTDPASVCFELDCYWAAKAGHDPLHVIHEHGDRIRLLHLKDMASDGSMTSVGSGTIDYAAVLSAAKSVGVAHVYVEHDNPVDPFASLASSVGWLKS